MTFKDLDKLISSTSDRMIEENRVKLEQETLQYQQEQEYQERRRLFLTKEDYEKEHRFALYRHVRAHKRAPTCGFTYEDVYDSITQEELDWDLEQKLGRGFVIPEQRYQAEKKAWFEHPSCCFRRNQSKGQHYDGYGCFNGKCIPECRYFEPTGRIEDSEIIQRHEKVVQGYRDRNAIVQAPALPLKPVPGHPNTCECYGR